MKSPIPALAIIAIFAISMPQAARAQEDPGPTTVESPSSLPEPAVGGSPFEQALATGNALFEEGRYEEAVDAYGAGYDPAAPHSTLVYNLATSLHQLDRLPEAILWYRRGDVDDPWLQENLFLARRSLGSQQIPLGGLGRLAVEHGGTLTLAAILVAWLTLLLAALGPRLGRRPAVVMAITALGLYGCSFALELSEPRAGVLLADCPTSGSSIPAGTELWVRETENGWRVLGTADEVVCPRVDIGLVSPDP